jgi:hypothetical protein
MKSFDLYVYYLALKQHFTKDSYDYFRYGGKVSASTRAFEGRNDRYYFDKLAKLKDPRSFILANIVERGAQVWVGELVNSDAAEVAYNSWLKRNQSLTYSFSNELGQLDDDFDTNFRLENGGHPPLLKLYLRGVVSIETLVILVHLTGCYNKWSKAMEYDPVWQEVAMKVRKYQPFMTYELPKFKKIVVDKFS